MKVRIQTLTGQICAEVETPEDATIAQLKGEIYKSGQSTGAVRILKGQEILPDGDTLVQHDISEGDTVNIVIEPEKKVNITVQFYGETFQHEVHNTLTVLGLKRLLTQNRQVGFDEDDFELMVGADDKKVELTDHSLPLLHFGVNDGSVLSIFKNFLIVEVKSEIGAKMFFRFPKAKTVRELKTMVKAKLGPSEGTNVTLFDSIFEGGDNHFIQLDVPRNLDKSIRDIKKDGDRLTVFVMVETVHDQKVRAVLYKERTQIGTVFSGQKTTDDFLKLRVQHQLGIPAGKVKVTYTDIYFVCTEGYQVVRH